MLHICPFLGVVCDYFSKHANTSSPGGKHLTPEADYNTLTKCKQACQDDSVCYAVDFQEIQKLCYAHTSATYKDGATSAPGVTQYRKTDTCAGMQ